MYSYRDLIWNYEMSAGSKFTLLLGYVLQVVVWWRLFEKAGEEGWKSLIPIYNVWVAFNIANPNGSNILWFIGSFIPGIQFFVFLIMGYMFASKYTDNLLIRILYMIFPFFTGLLIAFSDEFHYSPNRSMDF